MIRQVTVHKLAYVFGIRCFGNEVTLTGRWKVAILNDEITMFFELVEGGWWEEDRLLVKDYTEYINDCKL